MKKEKININNMTKENTEDIKDIYEYVYDCDKCGTRYGSDKEELKEHICPICEQK